MSLPATVNEDSRPLAGSPAFVTTRWSVVVSAQRKDSPEATQALEQLCHAYWYPLYAHVRRAGHSPADAEDLTQAFFARLLAKDWLAVADRQRGRFRSFLLSALKHFLANEWDKGKADKRGGRHQIISLDAQTADARLQHEPAHDATPDKEFDRRWALALLDTVLAGLRKAYIDDDQGGLFEGLKCTLGGGRSEVPYLRLAAELKMSEGAIRVAAHRLRKRYRERLREEIAQTVATRAEVEDELRQLFAALAG